MFVKPSSSKNLGSQQILDHNTFTTLALLLFKTSRNCLRITLTLAYILFYLFYDICVQRFKYYKMSRALVAHTYNPSYSGGRDQANSSPDSISKKIHHKKKAAGVAQDIGPEFKPPYSKKKKKQILQDENFLFP
jgi:hypothetical protein